MRIAIGADHAGFALKQHLVHALRAMGHDVDDRGTHADTSTDYPPICADVAREVVGGRAERGIVLGGSGNGEAIVANRVPGVRCSLCWNAESARLARAHNDANVLSMGERMLSAAEAVSILDVWLETPFEGGRHARRIAMIDSPE